MSEGTSSAATTNVATDRVTLKWAAWAPRLHSLLRIVAAFLFLAHGTSKVIAWPVGIPPDGGTAAVMSQAWFAGLIEAIGGVLLLLGRFTRPVAFILACEMAFAYIQAHAPVSAWPIVNNGELALLYCLVWLYFSAAGAGPWSLDARRRRS